MTASETEKLFFAAHAKRTAGELAEAEQLLRAAAAFEPKSAPVQTALAEVLLARGRASQAIEAAGRAVTLDAHLAPAHIALGIAAGELGNRQAALKHLRQATQLAPASVAARTALLRTLTALGLTEDATACVLDATAALGGDADGLNNFGTVVLDLGQAAAAQMLFDAAHASAPEDTGILVNLARAAGRAADDDAADAAIEKALSLAPADPKVRRAAGMILVNRGQPAAALAHLDAALERLPGDADSKMARGLARLALGDWSGGWPDYEARLDASRGPGRRRFSKPRWRPGMGNCKRVLLHAEQGNGDTIQFVRYAKTVKATGVETIVQVQAPLADLLHTAPGVDTVLGPGDQLPPFDAEAPLPSLPGILGATPSDPVIAFPYLAAPAGSVPELPDGPGPLVGLVWAGNPAYINDRRRSPGLAVLAPLLSIPNTRLVGLQVGAAVAELERFDPQRRILDLSNTLTDFAATARILMQLDLMITSDTAIVHLAGALGRPCWLMLPTGADFRWGLSGERTNWYPSLRLFRQSAPEDWSSPVQQMAAALSELER